MSANPASPGYQLQSPDEALRLSKFRYTIAYAILLLPHELSRLMVQTPGLFSTAAGRHKALFYMLLALVLLPLGVLFVRWIFFTRTVWIKWLFLVWAVVGVPGFILVSVLGKGGLISELDQLAAWQIAFIWSFVILHTGLTVWFVWIMLQDLGLLRRRSTSS